MNKHLQQDTALNPVPGNAAHVAEAADRRQKALDLSAPAVTVATNGESTAFAGTWPTSFTKGLPHDEFGIVQADAYRAYVAELNKPGYTQGGKRHAPFDVPRHKGPFLTAAPGGTEFDWRGWESPIAGHQFVLEGPDSGAVGIAPAPRLGSDELAAEMAEVYAMAVLRDTPFETMRDGGGDAARVVGALSAMEWFRADGAPQDADGGDPGPVSRARRNRAGAGLSDQTLFRGSSGGCEDGPYVSQFLLQGHDARNARAALEAPMQIQGRARDADGNLIQAQDGMILYGSQRIDQRIEPQTPAVDYLRDWAEWRDVQNGANTKNVQGFDGGLKFIETPRDLATYVHFDALYQAYLNACLLMLSWGTPADPGLPEPDPSTVTRDPFATFGGPHILTLVTETATRALRAVRRQKFNFHNRARPERLGAVAALAANGHGARLGQAEPFAAAHLAKLETASAGGWSLLDAVADLPAGKRFATKNGKAAGLPVLTRNLLLPMAFPEGSPMHPSYGAGHATVAGACVTVLKAFFRTHDGNRPLTLEEAGAKAVYVPGVAGAALTESVRPGDTPRDLTLAGELNKLAANISIGRNMAGVHYYSDYFDSLRMGERIAVGILLEQMTNYTETVSMDLQSFDGDQIRIVGDGLGGARMDIRGSNQADWWVRHLPQQI